MTIEVIRFLSGYAPAMTIGNVLHMGLDRLEARLHPVLRTPRCPDCSCSARRPQPTLDAWARLDAR